MVALLPPDGRPGRRNEFEARCQACSEPLPIGAGRVWRCAPGGACRLEGHAQAGGGWHVTCDDVAACKARLATPPRSREERASATAVAVAEAVARGALTTSIAELAQQAVERAIHVPGVPEADLSESLRLQLPPWESTHVTAPRWGAIPSWPPPQAPQPVPQEPRTGYVPSTTCPPPGPAHREWMPCPECGARAECFSDSLGVQAWQCQACRFDGRLPSIWETCASCGQITRDDVAPWVCPGCGRDRRPVRRPPVGVEAMEQRRPCWLDEVETRGAA
jgi:hypothetical protein